MDKVVKRGGGVVGKRQDAMDELYTRRTTNKLKTILSDETHPLKQEYDWRMIERSGRYRVPKARTTRYLNSFVPKTISFHNLRGGRR